MVSTKKDPVLEDWFGLDPTPIVGGNFERIKFL